MHSCRLQEWITKYTDKIPVRRTSDFVFDESHTLCSLLEEPRPHVVGIGWVVECVEKREKIDELKHKIELDEENVAGSSKVKFPSYAMTAS